MGVARGPLFRCEAGRATARVPNPLGEDDDREEEPVTGKDPQMARECWLSL